MDDLICPFFAKKKSTASLHRQALKISTLTPTKNTEDKSLSYSNAGYERELAIRGSYLGKAKEVIVGDSKTLCQTLLTTTQTVPQNTLFRDDLFDKTCQKLRNRNVARIVKEYFAIDCSVYQTLATYGADKLKSSHFQH